MPLQTAASGLIMGLSADGTISGLRPPMWFLFNPIFGACIIEKAAARIGQDGGVQDVLAALRAFPNNGGIVTNCCGALWSLAVTG